MEINSDLFCQSGSNDNGKWIKFADGTMICYGSGAVLASTGSTTVTYPETFSTTPNLQLTAGYVYYADISISYGSPTASSFQACSRRASTGAVVDQIQYFSWLAIGRWK